VLCNCYVSAAGDGVWIISAEDRAKHNAQFEQLKPVNGFVSGITNIFIETDVCIKYSYCNCNNC